MDNIEGIKAQLLEEYFFNELDEGGNMKSTPLFKHNRGQCDITKEIMLRFELNELEAIGIIKQSYSDVMGIEEMEVAV